MFTEAADIRRGDGITEWISRSGRFNATAEKPARDAIDIPGTGGRKAIRFDHSRYYIDGLELLPTHPKSCGYTCVTFRTGSSHEQVIASSFEEPGGDYSEIFVTGTEIGIMGRQQGVPFQFIIQHVNRDWTTLFLEYAAGERETGYRYNINNYESGEFVRKDIQDPILGCALGGRYNDTRFFDGDIAGVEVYHNTGTAEMIPSCLRDLIISSQMIT